MDHQESRIRIQKFFPELYEGIDVKETHLLDQLYSRKVLTDDDVERIRKEVTRKDANKKLLLILGQRGKAAFDCFIECLGKQNGMEDLITLVTKTPIDIEKESIIPYRLLEMKYWSTPQVVDWLYENDFSTDIQILFSKNRIQGFDLLRQDVEELKQFFPPHSGVTNKLLYNIFERRNRYLRDSMLAVISEDVPEDCMFEFSREDSFRKSSRRPHSTNVLESSGDHEYAHHNGISNATSGEIYSASPGSCTSPTTPFGGSVHFNTYPKSRNRNNSESFGHEVNVYEMQQKTYEDIFTKYQRSTPEERDDIKKFVSLSSLDPKMPASVAHFAREALEFEAECLNARRKGTIYFGFDCGRPVGVFMLCSERLDLQQMELSKQFRDYVDRAFEQNGPAKLYIAQRAIHGPFLTKLGPPPGPHPCLITLEIHPLETIMDGEVFPVCLPRVNIEWSQPEIVVPDAGVIDEDHMDWIVHDQSMQAANRVRRIEVSQKRRPVQQESFTEAMETKTTPPQTFNAAAAANTSRLVPDRGFIDLHSPNENAPITDKNQGAPVAATNLNKTTSGSTFTLLDGAMEVVENAINGNLLEPAMHAINGVAKAEKSKSKFSGFRRLFSGIKTKGSLSDKAQAPSQNKQG